MKVINNLPDNERYTTIVVALAELGYEQEDAKYFLNTLMQSAFDAGYADGYQSAIDMVHERDNINIGGQDFWDWLNNEINAKNDVPQRKTSRQWAESQIERMTQNLEQNEKEQYKIATKSRISLLLQLIDYIEKNHLYARYH